MKDYFIATILIILFLSIVDLIVTKSKNGKVVKMVISLVSVTLLSAPIVSIVKNGSINFDSYTIDYEYSNHLLNLETSIIKSKIKTALNDINFVYEDVNLCVLSQNDSVELKKIIIKVKNEVIIGSDAHINMIESVKSALKNIIDTDLVVIEIESLA